MQPKITLTDTHCHIHSVDYSLPITEVDAHNREAGVEYLLCVGCDAADSERAVRFVVDRPQAWASVGQHPHEAKFGAEPLEKLRVLVEQDRNLVAGDERRGSTRFFPQAVPRRGQKEGADRSAGPATASLRSDALSTPFSLSPARVSGTNVPAPPGSDTVESREGAERRQTAAHSRERGKIVAIGECGLDYFYGHSSKQDQEKALRYQIELALEYDLPMIFHVREAFDDFWPIFDDYQGIRGVLHSFTDSSTHLSKAIARGLYIGVNGIMTFTKIPEQLEVARHIPLDRLVLETDSPFLTPAPLRGTVNEPAHVLLVARFLSDLRQISLQEVALHTTSNARQLFSL